MREDNRKPFSLVEKGGPIANIKTTDQVLEEIGFGWFHIQLIIIAGIALSCEAMELSLLTFLQGCVTAEWDLSQQEKSMLTSAVYVGQLIGLLLFGTLADHYGRRTIVLIGWTFIVVFGIASAASPNVWVLLVFRALVGVGIASQVVMFNLALEILPAESRGRLLIYSSLFFGFGELMITGMAFAILDTAGWRWLLFLAAAPVFFILIVGIWAIPESPRWLVSQNRIAEAEAVLTGICITNNQIIPSYILKGNYGGEGYKEGSFSELISNRLFFISRKVWPIW